MASEYFLSSVNVHKSVPYSSYSILHDIKLEVYVSKRTNSCKYLRSVLDNRNKMWTDIHFKIKSALTPEFKIWIITEQKRGERLHLFNIIRLVITHIQDVLLNSSKQKRPIKGVNLM
jgi:hypothetical protein